jgi:hypothetical protein
MRMQTPKTKAPAQQQQRHVRAGFDACCKHHDRLAVLGWAGRVKRYLHTCVLAHAHGQCISTTYLRFGVPFIIAMQQVILMEEPTTSERNR